MHVEESGEHWVTYTFKILRQGFLLACPLSNSLGWLVRKYQESYLCYLSSGISNIHCLAFFKHRFGDWTDWAISSAPSLILSMHFIQCVFTKVIKYVIHNLEWSGKIRIWMKSPGVRKEALGDPSVAKAYWYEEDEYGMILERWDGNHVQTRNWSFIPRTKEDTEKSCVNRNECAYYI